MDRRLQKALMWVDEILWTARQVTAVRNALVHHFGLDRQRWAVLMAILRSDYCLSISDLARILRQSRQATHRRVVELAREGWLELLANRDDRRLVQLRLTARGKNVIGQARQRFTTLVLECSAHLDEQEIRAALGVLSSLRGRMTDLCPAPRAGLLRVRR